MVNIIYLICIVLIGFPVGVFAAFVISKLREIKNKTDNIPTSKLHWSMGVYIDDIPQNEQNILHLGSVPLKIYEGDEYSNLPIPRVGEEVGGIYHSSENRFEMTGIVEHVFYNTNMNLIVVSCKCTDIQKLN